MKRIATFVSLFAVVAFLPPFFLAPLYSENEPQDFTFRSNTRLVLLDVSVQNRSGGLVGGLAKDNFRVFDNGKPVDISVFANHDVPVTVGILVDHSFSMRSKHRDVVAAALTFIQASNPKDEIFVLNFNDTVKRGLPAHILFSDNVSQLRTALNRGLPEGKTALNDAVVDGLKQLDLGKRDKKTLVLVSDGGDNASHTTRQQMLDMVSRSFATIYTIGIYDSDDADKDPGILKKLAQATGGMAYFPESLEGMLPVCRSIASDIRTRYTLGYRPPETETGKHHKIRVEASAPGQSLKIRTRAGYWNENLDSPLASREGANGSNDAESK